MEAFLEKETETTEKMMTTIQNHLIEMAESMDLIRALSNRDLSDDHWTEIRQLLSTNVHLSSDST